MPRGLRPRVVLVGAGITILILIGLGALLVPIAREAVADTSRDRLQTQARQLARALEPLLVAGDAATLETAATAFALDDLTVTIFDADGALLASSARISTNARMSTNEGAPVDASRMPEVAAALRDGSATDRRTPAGQPDQIFAAAAVTASGGDVLGVVVIAAPTDAPATIARITRALIIALAVAALLAVAGAFVVAEQIDRPLRRLRRATRDLLEGRRSPPLHVRGVREVEEIIATFNDLAITLRRQLDVAAAEHERLEQTLAASADIVIAVDHDGVMVYANAAAQSALTASVEQALGRPLLSVLLDHEIDELITQALAGAEPAPMQLRRDAHYYQASAKPVTGGGLWAALLVMHDVTALHDAEAARREFVADVSHELRTPIASISAAVETLESGVDAPDAIRFQRIIHDEADKMAQVVEEMLDLARLESGLAQPQLRSFDLRDTVREAVERLRPQAERAGITITAELTDTDATLTADPDLVQRALVNLLHNAVKFTAAPGAVTAFLRLDADAVWLFVRDTGIGLSAADQGRVFQRFYRADRARRRGAGTGLGLALVRHIAEVHGGDVSVESELGHGATFAFSIPRSGG